MVRIQPTEAPQLWLAHTKPQRSPRLRDSSIAAKSELRVLDTLQSPIFVAQGHEGAWLEMQRHAENPSSQPSLSLLHQRIAHRVVRVSE